MKIEALRRASGVAGVHAARDLAEVQELLEAEVLSLRDLMQALRPIDLDASEQLGSVLSSLVDRFQRDSGISVRFVSAGGPFILRPAVALEIVRIVQEALVNVRKHSGARNVLVRLTRSGSEYCLVVEDDGRGFDFDGRLSARELDGRGIGPVIIKERARMVGGQLALESTPGVGTRVELTFAGERV
jgi:signal transduction histidine kinase